MKPFTSHLPNTDPSIGRLFVVEFSQPCGDDLIPPLFQQAYGVIIPLLKRPCELPVNQVQVPRRLRPRPSRHERNVTLPVKNRVAELWGIHGIVILCVSLFSPG